MALTRISAHAPLLNVPCESVLKVTGPVGDAGGPSPVSVTVTPHAERLPTDSDAGTHETAVETDR